MHMLEERLFSIGYKSIYSEEPPNALSLDELAKKLEESVNVLENSKIEEMENLIKQKTCKDIQKENIKQELERIIANEYKQIYQISSLLKSFLIFFDHSTNKIEKTFQTVNKIIQKQQNITIHEKLDDINIQDQIIDWTSVIEKDLQNKEEETKQRIDKKMFSSIECTRCYKRPAIFYSIPCYHPYLCAVCYNDLATNTDINDKRYQMCPKCFKKIEEIKQITRK